ncbi:gamma-butyrobetaine dioxygenase-like [Diadema antillarum]|uniref:gamma-butyrobetaine dioxygenase-like n=1 Tax=Diadema antillarum TaxID=105358 RepID=UPI003A859D37
MIPLSLTIRMRRVALIGHGLSRRGFLAAHRQQSRSRPDHCAKSTLPDVTSDRSPSGAVGSSAMPTKAPKNTAAFHIDAPLTESWSDWTPITWSSMSSDGRLVSVGWSDGETQDYPVVWLRDNCHSEKCYDWSTDTRKTSLMDLFLEPTKVQSISVIEDGQVLSVVWSHDHRSDFPTNWLRGHRFDRSARDPVEGTKPILWGADVMETDHFRTFDFLEVMESDDALYDWLTVLHNLGFGILKRAPKEQGQQVVFQKRLGYDCPSPSPSGVVNQIREKSGKHNPAYSDRGLTLHTDLTYYHQPKGLQLFHCIQQAGGSGGDSLLVDGFKVAEDLKSSSQQAFDLLTTVPWDLDDSGQVCKIVTNDVTRASMLRMPPEEVDAAYEALWEFYKLAYDPRNLLQFKLEPGDLLAFHNHRVLHGRLGFTSNAQMKRHLETCYSDWEIVSARMRQIKTDSMLEAVRD